MAKPLPPLAQNPTLDAKRMLDNICRAIPRRNLPLIFQLRAKAYHEPTVLNLMYYDRAAICLVNSPSWNMSKALLRSSCLTNDISRQPQFYCTCPFGLDKKSVEVADETPPRKIAQTLVEAFTDIITNS